MMSDPTPEEIRARRVKLHCERGELSDAETIAGGVDYDHLIPDDEEASPELLAISQIGLSRRIAVPLEEYGVIFAGDLCCWSEERLRLIRKFGDGSIAEIRRVLASLGLSLRVQAASERTPQLPPTIENDPLEIGRQKITEHQINRMLAMIGDGISQREIGRRMGLCRWTIWNRLRSFKVAVRSMIAAGATEDELESRLGADRWAVWQKSQEWDERNNRQRMAAA